MNRSALIDQIFLKKSFLCIGLDTDISKIPEHLKKADDPVFEFNKAIIDATHDLCVSYKPNIAFYECQGPKGWISLEKTMKYIQDISGDIFTIADAKRGDIGNTSKMYAKTFFDYFNFDAVTVAPYMGQDSITPFFEFMDKWVILLGLTSNYGSQDFQEIINETGDKLYTLVIRKAQQWGNPSNLMFVIGATHPESFKEIRVLANDYFFLVPGVGTQGGDMNSVVTNGRNAELGLLINSSREIIYASKEKDFQDAARAKALILKQQMSTYF
ncbi:MAG: orotidine-5'-phosphate decarboxylase [Saprospiraceae bacterium]|nr:orotidine-5'-phosphate decarboxylase [Saprospiraceae bacterium]